MFDHIPEPYRSLHKQAYKNREQILASKLVSCFYCCRTYPPSEITEWTDNDQTAICPCWVDSVLPGQYTPEFLREMYKWWFAVKETV